MVAEWPFLSHAHPGSLHIFDGQKSSSSHASREAGDCNFQKYQLLEFLFLHESREACKLVLSIPEGIVER
jgi:hypothetical protein